MPIPVPCRQSNGRSEDARLEITGVTAMKVIGRDREVPRSSVLNGLFARRSNEPGRLPLACTWSAILTRIFQWIRRFFGRQDLRSWRSRSPRGRACGLVPHPRCKALLYTASRPRNLSRSCALSMLGVPAPREAYSAQGEEGFRAWWAWRGLTHEGPDVTVRSTSPLRRFVLGFLETERVAGAVCSASFGVEHESGEKAKMEAPRKSMQKVRLKP
jgi:hypothetical protein